MNRDYSVKELIKYFDLSKQTVRKYLRQLEQNKPNLITRGSYNKYLLKEEGLRPFENILNNNKIYTDNRLLKFIICDGFKSIIKDNQDLILQFTKRTSLEQKRDNQEFEELPEFLQKRYQKFAAKVLHWIKTKFLSEDLTKIIIDRLPKWRTNDKDKTDIRITLYESSHPSDLNLIIKEEINYLQKIQLDNLKLRLETLNKLDQTQIDTTFQTPKEFMVSMSNLLNTINNERIIKKIFKFIIGSKPCYKIVAEPEIIIMDFTKLDLPSSLEANYHHHELSLKFDNDCFLTAKLANNESNNLVINFKELPHDLELISL